MLIIGIAIISEVALVALAYLLALVFSLEIYWRPSLSAFAIGALAALPLLIGNQCLWTWTERHPESVYARFSREIIVPLCSRITPSQALAIGILSGIGEEVLFRGALNLLLLKYAGNFAACALTSLLFAWVHFIGSVKRYGGMIPLYTGVGVALWYVAFFTESLTAAATTHAAYNFAAIVWTRRRCAT